MVKLLYIELMNKLGAHITYDLHKCPRDKNPRLFITSINGTTYGRAFQVEANAALDDLAEKIVEKV